MRAMALITRREFVSAAAGAALLTARSRAQVAGSGERIRLGVIGCGSMATSHMRALLQMKESDNVEVAAVCDVFDKRTEKAAQLTGARPFKDYRLLLESKDHDYVLIATPEHWHFQMTMDALNAGKHVYCEKPLTHTSGQARKIVEAVRQKSSLKLQVGVQGMSDDSYEAAREVVKQGVLGKVVQAQIDYSRNHRDDFWAYPIDEDARPGVNLDWNAWLGPAPKRPFDPDRCFRWRCYWDYSGGIASDLFIHRVTRIIKALDLTFPQQGAGFGGKWQFVNSKAEIPDTFNVVLDYPAGPTVLLVSSMANDTRIEHVLRGHKATLEFTKTGFVVRPQGLFTGEVKEFTHQKTGGEEVDLHHRNLLNAIRRNEPLKCDALLGYYGVVACEMGVQAFRQRKLMKWDASRQRIAKA